MMEKVAPQQRSRGRVGLAVQLLAGVHKRTWLRVVTWGGLGEALRVKSGATLKTEALRWRKQRGWQVLTACLSLNLLCACASTGQVADPKLAPAREQTSLGPGDIFQLEIVGEKELPREFQVATDGTVNLPYLPELKVEGLEPQQLAALVRAKLIEAQILTEPSVVVSVREYRSKQVTVLGQVQRPGSFPLGPGMSLIQAISLSGGLTSIAQGEKVTLTRVNQGESKTVTVNVEAISEGRAHDLPLQAGDRIFIPERVF